MCGLNHEIEQEQQKQERGNLASQIGARKLMRTCPKLRAAKRSYEDINYERNARGVLSMHGKNGKH